MSKSDRTYRDNRGSYDYVAAGAWKWFREAFLFGDELRVVIVAGSRNAARILRFFSDSEGLKAAGMPFRIRVVAVFSEDIADAATAFAANAHLRQYRYLLDFDPDVLLLNRDVSFETMAPIWQRLQGSRFREYIRSIKKWCCKLDVPLSYLNPNSDEGRAFIAESAGTKGSRRERPYHMLMCNPTRNYMAYGLRRNCGEISESAPTEQNPKNRELVVHQGNALFGLNFGFHPNLLIGRQFGLNFMAGASPVDYYVEHRINSARLAVMGLGPGRMDNKDLYLFDGAPRSFCLKPAWPTRKRTAQECHEGGFQIVDWIWSNMEQTLRGGVRTGIPGISLAIAERVLALYEAHQAGLNFSFKV